MEETIITPEENVERVETEIEDSAPKPEDFMDEVLKFANRHNGSGYDKSLAKIIELKLIDREKLLEIVKSTGGAKPDGKNRLWRIIVLDRALKENKAKLELEDKIDCFAGARAFAVYGDRNAEYLEKVLAF